MFLSVIIPVFNTPYKYFVRCIESIMKCDHLLFEVIVVDDGSSSQLSSNYSLECSKYENITYLIKKNGGVSSARNLGIINAKGEYLTFVDADDIVSNAFVEEAYAIFLKYAADVIMGNFRYYPEVKLNQYSGDCPLFLKGGQIEELKKAYIKSIANKSVNYDGFCIYGTACAKLYKRSLLIDKNIKFAEGITHWEDQLFVRDIINNINSATVVSNVWYTYYQNEFSAMHSGLGTDISKFIAFFNEWNIRNNSENDAELKKLYQLCDLFWFYNALENQSKLHKIQVIESSYSTLRNLQIFQSMIQDLTLNDLHRVKDKIKLLLLKCNCKKIISMICLIKRRYIQKEVYK